MGTKPLSILIVEHDVRQGRQIVEALEAAGFDTRTAESGWEAQKALRSRRPDLIVASLRLPDMDGVAIRDGVLSDLATRDIPFLFLTESGDVEQEIEALRSRVDDFIEKPLNPVVLVERVKAVLARRAEYDAMVRVDPLTRLLKRHSLEEEIAVQLREAAGAARTDSVVMLDPEEIGRLNREHGWTMGDLILTCLAGIVCTKIRTEDIAGRLELDKFVLYLPGTPAEGAEVLIGRIDTLLRTVSSAIAGLTIGLSAAILEVPAEAGTFEEALTRAHDGLAQAKARGKNQVVRIRNLNASEK